MKKILFVEGDKEYREKVTHIIKSLGYNVTPVENAIIGIAKFMEQDYELVITDLQMEEMSGVKFISYLKKINPRIKTIILTSDPTAETELESISLQINKYLRKDLRIDIILKYIEKVLDIPSHQIIVDSIFESRDDDLFVNISKREVRKNGDEIRLTKKEFEVLNLLIKNRGCAVSREQFIEEIWDTSHETVDTRIIDTHLTSLRKKLKLVSIISIRGYGYKLND